MSQLLKNLKISNEQVNVRILKLPQTEIHSIFKSLSQNQHLSYIYKPSFRHSFSIYPNNDLLKEYCRISLPIHYKPLNESTNIHSYMDNFSPSFMDNPNITNPYMIFLLGQGKACIGYFNHNHDMPYWREISRIVQCKKTIKLKYPLYESYDYNFEKKEDQQLLKNTFPNIDTNELAKGRIDNVIIGEARFHVIQIGRITNNGDAGNFFMILDEHSGELMDLEQILDLDDPGTFKRFKKKKKVKSHSNSSRTNPFDFFRQRDDDKMNAHAGCTNIVLIDRVKINKNMRGHNFGKLLVQRIIDNFGSSEARIVLKPYPLQWEQKENWNNEDKMQFEKDQQRVIKVWEEMGFEQIGDTEYWGRNEAFRHPMTIFK